jgi:hypothetical protein
LNAGLETGKIIFLHHHYQNHCHHCQNLNYHHYHHCQNQNQNQNYQNYQTGVVRLTKIAARSWCDRGKLIEDSN